MTYYSLCWLLLRGQAAFQQPQSPKRHEADLPG